MRLHVSLRRATCAWASVLSLIMLIMAGPTSVYESQQAGNTLTVTIFV